MKEITKNLDGIRPVSIYQNLKKLKNELFNIQQLSEMLHYDQVISYINYSEFMYQLAIS